MLRNALGLLTGIAVAVLTVMLMQWISHTVYPPPTGIDLTDTDAHNALLAAAPFGALLLVLAGYLFATFDGVMLACLIGRTRRLAYALIIGVLMLAATSSELIMYQHPAWFSVSAIVGIVASAWLALKIARAAQSARPDAE
jgi:ABC-type nitrate/sulfonate/bicarbonate transport system permease component